MRIIDSKGLQYHFLYCLQVTSRMICDVDVGSPGVDTDNNK